MSKSEDRLPSIELLHMDCMEYLRTCPDKAFDLAIVDPPYGIGMNGHRYAPIKAAVLQTDGKKRYRVQRKDYGIKEWDNKPPSRKYFRELRRVSTHQIIWGANHFIDRVAIPSSCWLVWDKVNGETNQADAELAWTSFDTAVRVFPFMWNGMCQGHPLNGRRMQGNKALNEERIHPTQKPVALYDWILKTYAKPGYRILDTHCGSASIAIACETNGCDLVAMDRDADYIDGARKRFAKHMGMFSPLIKEVA